MIYPKKVKTKIIQKNSLKKEKSWMRRTRRNKRTTRSAVSMRKDPPKTPQNLNDI